MKNLLDFRSGQKVFESQTKSDETKVSIKKTVKS